MVSKGWAKNTIKGKLSHVKVYAEYVHGVKLVTKYNLKSAKEGKLHTVMSLKEVEQLWKALDKLPDKTYSLMCRLLWDGAARLEDVFNIFWENITYGRNHDAEVTVPAGKTKSGRFYLTKETASALKAFGGKNKRGPVFTRWHPVDLEL